MMCTHALAHCRITVCLRVSCVRACVCVCVPGDDIDWQTHLCAPASCLLSSDLRLNLPVHVTPGERKQTCTSEAPAPSARLVILLFHPVARSGALLRAGGLEPRSLLSGRKAEPSCVLRKASHFLLRSVLEGGVEDEESGQQR